MIALCDDHLQCEIYLVTAQLAWNLKPKNKMLPYIFGTIMTDTTFKYCFVFFKLSLKFFNQRTPFRASLDLCTSRSSWHFLFACLTQETWKMMSFKDQKPVEFINTTHRSFSTRACMPPILTLQLSISFWTASKQHLVERHSFSVFVIVLLNASNVVEFCLPSLIVNLSWSNCKLTYNYYKTIIR